MRQPFKSFQTLSLTYKSSTLVLEYYIRILLSSLSEISIMYPICEDPLLFSLNKP